jgi:hypothetical protein
MSKRKALTRKQQEEMKRIIQSVEKIRFNAINHNTAKKAERKD